jgi:hypothetical protein
MWFSLIIAGALHGLILLPVILSLAGGPGFPMQEADEEWMATAIRSGYEYTSVGSFFFFPSRLYPRSTNSLWNPRSPFLADDISVLSD